MAAEGNLHHGAHEGHEGFGNINLKILNFVLFAIFVVKSLFRGGLRFAAIGYLW